MKLGAQVIDIVEAEISIGLPNRNACTTDQLCEEAIDGLEMQGT